MLVIYVSLSFAALPPCPGARLRLLAAAAPPAREAGGGHAAAPLRCSSRPAVKRPSLLRALLLLLLLCWTPCADRRAQRWRAQQRRSARGAPTTTTPVRAEHRSGPRAFSPLCMVSYTSLQYVHVEVTRLGAPGVHKQRSLIALI